MSATAPPCIMSSCFSVIAAISDVILSKNKVVVSAPINKALEAADGWNTDSNFIKFQELLRQATFTPCVAIETRNHAQIHYLLSAGRYSTLF